MMPMQPTRGLTGSPGITQPVLPAVMGKWQSNADIQAAETAAIDAKAGLGTARKRLVALAAELVGVAVEHADELVADQAVAEELLAKLTPGAES